MDVLPLELGLFVAAFVGSATARLSVKDLSTLCTGSFASLNVAGTISPGDVYETVDSECVPSHSLAATACRCNLVAYNLRQAQSVCQEEPIEPYSQWSQANQCTNTTTPPTQPGFDTSTIPLPQWASQALASNGTFDLNAALETSKGGSGWSGIQIAAPIIAGVGVAIVAVVLFLWYRHRKRTGGGSLFSRSRSQKAWQDANLQGPRRFFGLLPDRSTVRSRTRRDTGWAIDDNTNVMPANGGDSPTYNMNFESHSRVESRASGHSRTESRTSLITSSSRQTSQSFLSQLASRISNFSKSKAYKSGATKAKDYERIRVVPGNPDGRFRVDGSDVPTPKNDQFMFPIPLSARQESLPSVLDIRRPSTTYSRQATRDDSFPAPLTERYDTRPPARMYTEDDTEEARTDSLDRHVPRSEFSLGTTDLMTPTSPHTTSESPIAVSPIVRPPSGVSPASPLLLGNRFVNLPPLDEHPSTLLPTNASTDTLAYQLYPRAPPAF